MVLEKSPPVNPPDQIPPNLTLTQVGIHRGVIDQGEFSGHLLLYMFDIMAIVFMWIQLNWPWHSFVCSMAPDDSKLPFMLSCCCSIQRVNTFFFHSPIYLPLYEQSNWHTPGWLWGSSFGSFWHRMLCKFLPDVKVMSLFTF